MAVDVKTLTIGSHILVNGKRERVVGIRPVRSPFNVFQVIIQHEAKIFSSLGYVPSTSNAIEPIPITPELLKELGFRKGMSSAIGFDSWYCDMMRIDNNVMQAHPWWFYNQLKLRYLHELESLYYMLCGVELIKE
jgi:hypothetical protein|nr:MAG TPA: hypothetical protein [Caudoviricetes sp.]